MSEAPAPFVDLGKHLRYVREQSKQTITEVSGAVEIDARHLEQVEAGRERPEEDVLLLLITHFRIKDQEAIQLWEMGEYGSELPEQLLPCDNPDHDHEHDQSPDFNTMSRSMVVVVGMDARTIYSDGIDVMWNQAGMTMNFTQMTGPGTALAVARVGMSYDQAEQVLQTLQSALLRSKYLSPVKRLAPPSTPKDS